MLFINVLSKITSDFLWGYCGFHFCCRVVQYQLSVVQGLMSPAYWSVAPTGLGLFVGRGCATLHRLLNILRLYGALRHCKERSNPEKGCCFYADCRR